MKLRTFRTSSWSMLLVVLLIAVIVGACGGDSASDEPTSTPAPMPTREMTSTSVAASPIASPVSSPMASPQASPIGSPVGSPVSLTSGGSTMTRAEFKNALLTEFPMDAAASAGGTIILGSSGDISTTNPLLASDSTTINMLGQVFEPLLGASPIDGQPVPGLADSWTVSDDGLTYTFALNTAAKWHDGTDVTADDVQFSFDAVLNPNLNSQYRSQVREVVSSYRVIDADTFEITATDRFVTFLYNAPASVFIIPKHIWEPVPVEQWSFDGGSTGQDLSRVIGTGPFLFKSWEQGQRVTLAKNPNHYDTVPNIDEFVMVVQPETDTLVRSLESNDVDMIEILPAPDTERIQNTEGLTVSVYDIYSVTYFVMNMDNTRVPAFSDQRVRQAMYQSIDRQSITDNIFLGFGEAAVGSQPPLSPAYDPSQMQPAYKYDPAAAQTLLADAGWTDTDDNGVVDKDGDDLKLSIVYVGGDATVDAMLSYMQEAWNKIGIEVDLENISGEVLQQRLFDGEFDLSLIAINLTPDGSQGLLFTCDSITTGFNFGSYCNADYDALDAEQLREFDPAVRAQMQVELARIVWTDLPIGPIRFGVARTGYSTRIHNFFPNGYGFLWSLPFVWVDSGSE
jgi:peptide/nickel transport system substrate-binding protein